MFIQLVYAIILFYLNHLFWYIQSNFYFFILFQIIKFIMKPKIDTFAESLQVCTQLHSKLTFDLGFFVYSCLK